MLSVLAPRTRPSEKPQSNLHHVSYPRSTGVAKRRDPTRSYSLNDNDARELGSTTLRPSSALASSLSIHTAKARNDAAVPGPQRIPARSLSVYRSVPKGADLVAFSKASVPCRPTSQRPQHHDVPHLTKTPWEIERSKRNPASRRPEPARALPARIFKTLPREIYDCIVVQLEAIHLQHNQACQSCYLKDLHSLSLVSRAWDRAATVQMYCKIYLVGRDDHAQPLRPKVKGPDRLKLLRRTLRERPLLARRVRELHLPDFQNLYQQASIEREEVINAVASLIMTCPSLERLVGFHVPFTQSFDRVSYALATRTKLQERVWLLSEPEDMYSDGEDEDEGNSYYLAARDPVERFLDLNSGYPFLTTLVLHRDSGEFTPTLNFRAIIGTFRQLPMLQHLSISGLPATSFTNMTLNALPPGLLSLRLENLPGVNDRGLQKFTSSRLSVSIQNLTLLNLEISSLITVTNILSAHFRGLKRFTLAQYRTPDLPPRISIPNFRCPTLQFVHFEFRSQSSPAMDPFSPEPRKSVEFPFVNPEPISCLATSLLAMNIKEGAFPALRRVRVPYDPQGLLQAVCKPRATALLPSDTSIFARPLQKSGSHGYAIMVDTHVSESRVSENRESSPVELLSPRADSAIDSPIFDNGPSSSALSPAKVRLAAQARILTARKTPLMNVRVYDPEGEVCIETGIGGFIGDIKSNIVYDLSPDASRWPGSRDQSGPPQPEWTTGIEDLVDERTASSGKSREQHWGDCGHRVGGRTGRQTVKVRELF